MYRCVGTAKLDHDRPPRSTVQNVMRRLLCSPQELAAMGESFGSEDYMLPTPAWASYGAPEAGFDPKDTRVKKVRRHPLKADPGGCT